MGRIEKYRKIGRVGGIYESMGRVGMDRSMGRVRMNWNMGRVETYGIMGMAGIGL